MELVTLKWVSWFNHHRLLEPIGYIPPAEAEANYYRQLALQAEPNRLKPNGLYETRGDSISRTYFLLLISSSNDEPQRGHFSSIGL